VVIITVLFDTYGQLKEAIALVGGWSWDARFALLDRLIHGADPWRLLPQEPRFVVVMDRIYAMWFPLLAGLLTWHAWQRDSRRFILAFCLTWLILGVLAAHAFSSAGPCFYHLLGNDDYYGEFLSLLAQVDAASPLLALEAQEVFWSLHLNGQRTSFTGISAFPSMHVAIVVLWVLAAERPLLKAVLGLFAVAIFLGSVQLGWHYAVDGEASALAVPVVWWASGWLIRRVDAARNPI
jgi:hypothetical protein